MTKLRDLINEGITKVKIDDLDPDKHGDRRGILMVPTAHISDSLTSMRNAYGGDKELAKWKKDMKSKWGVKTVIVTQFGKVAVESPKYKNAEQDYIRKKGQALRQGDWPLD